MDEVKPGLIGLGWWGPGQGVEAAPRVRLDACFARTPASREQFAAEHGCDAASTLEDWESAGESGCIGGPPAVVNAVVDALAPLGVTHIDMPLRPHTVWSAIRAVPR